MHILIALVVCSLLGVFGYTIAEIYKKMCDPRLPMLTRFSMGWSVMWLMLVPLFILAFVLQWIVSQMWVVIFEPVTALLLGSAALVGYGGKKVNQYLLKKKHAEEVAALVSNYRDDFEWDKIPFEIKLRLAQYRKLFYQLLEKYSGADFDSTKPTAFVPIEIVELFEDGTHPIHFIPYFPRYYVALHQYKEIVKGTKRTLVFAGEGWKGWVYTHIIKLQIKVPTESFDSKASIRFDQDEAEKCIRMIEEYVQNVEYFIECACKELSAGGSLVFRSRVHERAIRLHAQARTIELFISQIGHASSPEQQRENVLKKMELLCNNMLVDPGTGVEIRVLPKGTEVFEGNAQEELKKRYARIEQDRIILEQKIAEAQREKQYYTNKSIELAQTARQLENQMVASVVPLQLTHQIDQSSPFSQPLPTEGVVTTFVSPSVDRSSENVLAPVASNDSEDTGELEVVDLQQVANS